jgi:hypothetical protein
VTKQVSIRQHKVSAENALSEKSVIATSLGFTAHRSKLL